MNKKIKILIVGLVLLIGGNVDADQDWAGFMAAVMGGDPTINLNLYLSDDNILDWQANPLTLVRDLTFVGLSGDNFATLDGGNTKQGFSITGKIIQFESNFELVNFSSGGVNAKGGAIYAERSSINFTNGRVNFTSNTAIQNGGAISAVSNSNINFTNSTVSFTGNRASKGSAIYLEFSTISFINTATFIDNRGESALYAKASQINISGDMEFIANIGGDIGLENSSLIFMPERGKSIRFKGEISDKGGSNKIIKAGEGEMIFVSAMNLENVDLNIERGTVSFETGGIKFNKINVSADGTLGISIEFTTTTMKWSYFLLDSIYIDEGASLSVETIGIASTGTYVPFVYSEYPLGDDFERMEIFSGDYDYSLSRDLTRRVGFLILKGVSPSTATPSPSPASVGEFNALLKSGLPSFTVNAIRQSAISDNSLIYSNVGERVWVAGQFSGGSLSDDLDGDFDSSAAARKPVLLLLKDRILARGFLGVLLRVLINRGMIKRARAIWTLGFIADLDLGGM